MSQCWLLRHGSSESNEAGATADSWLISITVTGERQAQEAAIEWAKMAPDRFRLFSSPMLRARQTAGFVQALFPEVPLETIDELREFEPFDFSHLPPMRPDARKVLMEEYLHRCDPTLVGEGRRAESFAHFRCRLERALATLRSCDADTLAVCHGGVIRLVELLLDPVGHRLDDGALMRAWLLQPTIRNCGWRQFAFEREPAVPQGGSPLLSEQG